MMFGKNLKYLRSKNGMEQIDLAHRLGRKSSSSISEWEKGRYTPKMGVLHEIAKIFNVSIDDLMEKDLSTPEENSCINADQVPVLAEISAGTPLYAEQNLLGYSYIPSFLNRAGKELFYLKVSGDSMDREFKEGDLVLVEKDSTIENGQIGVVLVNGCQATVKRVKYDTEKVYLIPESTNNSHLPQVYTADDEISFIGRVISSQKFY